MATWKKVIVSGSVAELSASLYRATGEPLQQVTNLASTTVLSGSFSGSFSGNGAGLTNIPYSSITDAPQGGGSGNVITSGSYSASFDTGPAGAFKVTTTSSIDSSTVTLLTVSSSGIVQAREAFTVGNVTGSRSFLSGLALAAGGGALTHRVFDPTEVKNWTDGDSPSGTSGTDWNTSIFAQLVNEKTPISDILYFLLRPYAQYYQVAGPNTRTFGTWTSAASGQAAATFTNTYPNARVPIGASNDTVLVDLTTAGWQSNGGQYLAGVPTSNIFTNLLALSNFPFFTVSSTTPAGTTGNSSGDTQAFGPGSLDSSETPRQIWLSASFDYKSRTGTVGSLSTWTSASLFDVTRTTVGSVNLDGLYYQKVAAGAGARQFTDMYFSLAPLGNNFRYKYDGMNTGTGVPTSVSAMGYYEVSASLWMVTASAAGVKGLPIIPPGTTPTNANRYKDAFYVPSTIVTYNNTTLATNFTSNASAQLTNTISSPIAGTIASSSLSGAPYITSASFAFSESISNVFRPLYAVNDVYQAGAISVDATATNTISITPALSNVAINPSNGQIQTANRVYSNDLATIRSTGDIPTFTDRILTNGVILFDASLAIANSNILVNATVTNPTVTISAPSVTRGNGAQTTLSATTRVGLIQAGDTQANPLNGSTPMAWRKLKQGQTSRAAATTGLTTGGGTGNVATERFLCETVRRQITNNLLTFSADPWSTTFVGSAIGNTDLQVKPGFLIRPGSTSYGYWITNPSADSDYKYYATEFDLSNMSVQSLVTNLQFTFQGVTAGNNNALVKWSDLGGSNTIAVAVLFESTKKNSTFNGGFTNGHAAFTDLADTGIDSFAPSTPGIDPSTGVILSNVDGLNPFGESIYLYANNGSTPLSNNIYTLNLNAPIKKQALLPGTSGRQKIYVVVRYKGDPRPMETIQVTVNQ